MLVDTNTYSTHPAYRNHTKELRPNLVVIISRDFSKESDIYADFRYSYENFNYFAKSSVHEISLVFFISIPDTDTYGHVNMTSLASTWRRSISWCRQNGTTLIISKAFDTPYSNGVAGKTNGRWRLRENPLHRSTTDYEFDDKTEIFTQVDENEMSLFKQSPQQLNFSKDHVQIIFSLYVQERVDRLQRATKKEMSLLLSNVLSKFNKVVLLIDNDSTDSVRVLIYELDSISRLSGQVEVNLLFMPHVKLSNIVKGSMKQMTVGNKLPAFRKQISCITSYIVPYVGNSTGLIARQIEANVLKPLKLDKYEFGYVFNVSVCISFTRMSKDERNMIQEAWTRGDGKTIIFFFEETEDIVKLGVGRMLLQRVVVLEQCKKLLRMTRRDNSVKLGFMMLHYSANSKFYDSKRTILNFIEYWQRLGDWALSTNTTIILSGTVDGQRYFNERGRQYITELGWWRYNEDATTKGDERNLKDVWVDKIQEISLRFPEKIQSVNHSGGLGTLEIILTVVLPVVMLSAIVIALVVFFVRRNYRELYLSTVEVRDFFHGRQLSELEEEGTGNASPHTLPYDKSRYEIDEDDFTIFADRTPLGSGTFGMVCLGKIHAGPETVPTAIKMVNPDNIHKTTIRGFLSEIKVLSHLGQHENITQLLGANTKNIRLGKGFIFLEFCELGSLDKYLRKVRPCSAETEVKVEQEEQSLLNKRVDLYLEMVARKKVKLDSFLYEDLYRWSTEICNGMTYLASKRIVHADLATRNIVLNSKKTAKICDFGLSRRMYNYTNYVKQQQEPLPWKWMSPESLRLLQFNEKSDVWAYGITLWEIYSLGEQPYQGMAWNLQFADLLEGGLRLCEPKYNEKNMYWIMKECWHGNPKNRPTFSDLLLLFN